MLELTFPAGAAFVTGGTGSVGGGAVTRLAEGGLPVTFTYRGNEKAARRLEERLLGDGHKVQAVQMDGEDDAAIGVALEAAEQFGGPLHTVALAAGPMVKFNKLIDFPIEEAEAFLRADAMAVYRVLHQVVPILRRNGGGSITGTTTIGTELVVAYDGMSPFSKGSVEALLNQLAAEEGEHGIRVNQVAIGIIFDLPPEQTREYVLANMGEEGQRMGAMFDQLLGLRRLDRHGTPGDAGNLFAFLASEQARFITGQRIAIDGGMTL